MWDTCVVKSAPDPSPNLSLHFSRKDQRDFSANLSIICASLFAPPAKALHSFPTESATAVFATQGSLNRDKGATDYERHAFHMMMFTTIWSAAQSPINILHAAQPTFAITAHGCYTSACCSAVSEGFCFTTEKGQIASCHLCAQTKLAACQAQNPPTIGHWQQPHSFNSPSCCLLATTLQYNHLCQHRRCQCARNQQQQQHRRHGGGGNVNGATTYEGSEPEQLNQERLLPSAFAPCEPQEETCQRATCEHGKVSTRSSRLQQTAPSPSPKKQQQPSSARSCGGKEQFSLQRRCEQIAMELAGLAEEFSREVQWKLRERHEGESELTSIANLATRFLTNWLLPKGRAWVVEWLVRAV